jgi:F0F1-type ATP synthase gamma subunit
MNFTRKNGKDILVLASANTGLYGDLTRRVFEYFANQVGPSVDVAILGKVGKAWFETRFPNRDFLYYELSDADPDPDEVSKIMDALNEYENIILFHGKFKDVLEQVPEQSGLSGDSVAMETREEFKMIHCIFEPSLEEIFEFFESEIKSSLFDHALYESALAKYTSRMVNLDRATSNVSDRLKRLERESLILKHRKADKQKNTLLAGVLYGR